VSARTADCVRRGGGGEGRRGEGGKLIRADGPMSARMQICFSPGNFKKDATVRPSHGRPRGHRLTVRPFEKFRVTTLPQILGFLS
jgi:hypothetical protein